MKQDSEARNTFFVATGETVTITFEPIKVPTTPLGDAERVHAADSGTVLPKKVKSRVVEFKFTVSQPPGKSHLVVYECAFFTTTDAPDAKYKILVAGRQGQQQSGPFKAGAATQLGRSGELWFTVPT